MAISTIFNRPSSSSAPTQKQRAGNWIFDKARGWPRSNAQANLVKSICKLRLFVGLQAVIIADSISTSFLCVACFIPTALLKENSTTNRYALLPLVVNTVVIGEYTKPNVGIAVPGIFAKGKYNGTNIDLLSYINGG